MRRKHNYSIDRNMNVMFNWLGDFFFFFSHFSFSAHPSFSFVVRCQCEINVNKVKKDNFKITKIVLVLSQIGSLSFSRSFSRSLSTCFREKNNIEIDEKGSSTDNIIRNTKYVIRKTALTEWASKWLCRTWKWKLLPLLGQELLWKKCDEWFWIFILKI